MNKRLFGCFAAGAMALAASSASAMPVVAGGAGWPTPVARLDVSTVAAGQAATGAMVAPASSGSDAPGNQRIAAAPSHRVAGDPGTVVTSFSPTAFAAAVPESASWAMLSVGVGMMGFALRRRRRSSAKPRFRFA